MRLIVRHQKVRATVLPLPPAWLALLLTLTLPQSAAAAGPLHLLGFAGQMCPGEAYCFELLVKPEFVEQVGERITVRFASVETIYDPENYELTLQQQNIAPGSHPRMLMTADTGRGPDQYQANVIWIGD